MKKTIFTTALVVALCMLSVGCSKSTKPYASGREEITVPLSGPEYSSNALFYRGTQSGISQTTSTAQKIAMQNARQQLASQIQSDVTGVIENYTRSRNVNNKEDVINQYKEVAFTVIDQQLTDVGIVGEKVFELKKGGFEYFVCLEMSKEKLKNRIVYSLEKNENLKVDLEIDKFKEIYNQMIMAE